MTEATRLLELQPFIDGLTGLLNRRGFLLLADQQHREVQRGCGPTVLFRIDVDGLRDIGDEHGHDEAEAVMVAVSELLRLTFRHADIAAHIGDGHFAVLALDCDAIDVLRRRLQTHVSDYTGLFPRPYELSVSVQVTPLDGDPAQPVEALLARRQPRAHAARS